MYREITRQERAERASEELLERQEELRKFQRQNDKFIGREPKVRGGRGGSTIWGVPSFVIFCCVFLQELQVPAWAVGSHSALAHQPGEFSKALSTKYHK